MSFDDLRALMEKRTSVRSFSSTEVPKDVIEDIIRSATLAPSIENSQPWRFHIVTNEDLKQELMDTSCYGNFVTDASAFIVVTCDRAAKGNVQEDCPIWNPKEMEYSCAGAMYAMMLAATAKGIDSCWVSLHHGPAHNVLKLPDHQVVVGGVMLGYAAETHTAVTHDRHPLTKMVFWHE